MAERKHGLPAPPTDTTIMSVDWDGRNLAGETHTRVLFQDVNMTELTNHGSTFEAAPSPGSGYARRT
jgi:hypothetical protein